MVRGVNETKSRAIPAVRDRLCYKLWGHSWKNFPIGLETRPSRSIPRRNVCLSSIVDTYVFPVVGRMCLGNVNESRRQIKLAWLRLPAHSRFLSYAVNSRDFHT